MNLITMTLYFSYKQLEGWHPFVQTDVDKENTNDFDQTSEWIGEMVKTKIRSDPDVSAVYIHEEPTSTAEESDNVVPFKFKKNPIKPIRR